MQIITYKKNKNIKNKREIFEVDHLNQGLI